MHRLLRLFRSHIRYKIILPYLSLMLLVTLAGASIALALTAASLQERLTEQLKQYARSTSTALVQRERDHLAFLFLVALSQANPETDALSMPDAFASNDGQEVIKAIQPYYDYQRRFKDSLDVDRFIAFDRTGRAYVDLLRISDDQPPTNVAGTSLASVADVQRVLQSTPDDEIDKYANLIQFLPDPQPYFYTVVPVSQNDQVVGGILVGIKIDRMLALFERTSQSVATTYYSNDGVALGSSLLRREDELPYASIRPAILEQLATSQVGAVFDTVNLRGRNYEFAYSPLVIAETQAGYFSVAISSDFQVEALSLSRNTVLAITLALAIGAVLVGYLIARSITRPLGDLVSTAEAVTAGDLEQRSMVQSQDELGRLGHAFNLMTEHLLRLYNTSRDLSSKIDTHSVLEVAGSTARSLVPSIEACVLLDDRGMWSYQLPDNASSDLRALEAVHLSTEDPLLNALARERAQVVLHADDSLLATSGLVTYAQFQDVLLTPLLIKDSLVGVLVFGSREADTFTPATLPTLTATANMSASVMYNALLYGQTSEEANERKAILQSIADGVIVVDDSRMIVLANEAAQSMLGVPLSHLLRRNFDELGFERAPSRQDMFGEANSGLDHYRVNNRIFTLSSAPVVSDEGRALGEAFVLHDISAEVAIDEAKTDFIATISHELRTPLTPIYSYIELLQRGVYGELNGEQREVMGVIYNRAEQLRGLIGNIVLVASIQSDTLATEIEPLDVGAVIETTVAPLQRAIEKKGLALHTEIPAGLPQVLGDTEQLRLILNQLIDNARRYTSAGSITIQAAQHNNMVQVDVVDTGPGIPPERISRLFTRFHRIDGNSSQERGGGLGLAITRQLVERLGGQVWAHSEVGHGSTFSFSLPIADGQGHAVAETHIKNTSA